MYSITGHKRTGPCNYLLWLARLLLAHYLYCPTRTHSRFASPNSKPKNRDANTIFPVCAKRGHSLFCLALRDLPLYRER